MDVKVFKCLVHCLYDIHTVHGRARSTVRVDCELSEEVEVKVGMQQGSVLSPFLFVIMVDVVIELGIPSILSWLLYADDLVLMSEMDSGIEWNENVLILSAIPPKSS